LPNRSRRSCKYCGAVLADDQQLQGKRAAFLKQMKAQESKRHREFMEREISTGGSPGQVHLLGM